MKFEFLINTDTHNYSVGIWQFCK